MIVAKLRGNAALRYGSKATQGVPGVGARDVVPRQGSRVVRDLQKVPRRVVLETMGIDRRRRGLGETDALHTVGWAVGGGILGVLVLERVILVRRVQEPAVLFAEDAGRVSISLLRRGGGVLPLVRHEGGTALVRLHHGRSSPYRGCRV